MNINELRERRKLIDEKTNADFEGMNAIITESKCVVEVAQNTSEIYDEIDTDFKRITALNNTDVKFMLFATLLQSLRWIIMLELKTPRMDELSPSISKDKTEIALDLYGSIWSGPK